MRRVCSFGVSDNMLTFLIELQNFKVKLSRYYGKIVMPRYRSRVGKKRGGSQSVGGSVPTGVGETGGSIRTGGILRANAGVGADVGPASGNMSANVSLGDFRPLPTHLAAAHAVLNTPSKTWRLVQHAAALHAGQAGSVFFPHIKKHHVNAVRPGMKPPKAAYKDMLRGSREDVAKGLMSERSDHIAGRYRGAGLGKAVNNAFHQVHEWGKVAHKHAKVFAKNAPGYWKKAKHTINKVDAKVEHAGIVMEATAGGVNQAMEHYAESGLAGSEFEGRDNAWFDGTLRFGQGMAGGGAGGYIWSQVVDGGDGGSRPHDRGSHSRCRCGGR
jgi:hypothetical protein